MTDAPTSYPFPDDTPFRQHIDGRERPVCGGFTEIEINQPDDPRFAFACSHGPVSGCGWRIPSRLPNAPHAVTTFEIDYADQLHREHAWQQLAEREQPH